MTIHLAKTFRDTATMVTAETAGALALRSLTTTYDGVTLLLVDAWAQGERTIALRWADLPAHKTVRAMLRAQLEPMREELAEIARRVAERDKEG